MDHVTCARKHGWFGRVRDKSGSGRRGKMKGREMVWTNTPICRALSWRTGGFQWWPKSTEKAFMSVYGIHISSTSLLSFYDHF